MLQLTALIVLIAALAIAYVMFMQRRRSAEMLPPCGGILNRPPSLSAAWTKEAGEDLGELNEPARCDLIFAASQLGDERAHRLLVNALADPSATVSLAAAHALARTGHMRDVENFAAGADSERSSELLKLLALID